MQIFEVLEVQDKYPYMEAREIFEGFIVKDIINSDSSKKKVFLIVDHVEKKIWAYFGEESSIKLQVFGVLLSNRIREQLKLFYRVDFLNNFSPNDPALHEILKNKIGQGKANEITIENMGNLEQLKISPPYITLLKNSNPTKVIENVYEFPQPDKFIRKFLIIGGAIYSEEEIINKFVEEEEIIKKPVKLGRLNNGFTFFDDQDYSTRILIKDRKIEAVELLIPEKERSQPLELNIPITKNPKFTNEGNLESLIDAFQVPPAEFTVEEIKQVELFEKIKSIEKEKKE